MDDPRVTPRSLYRHAVSFAAAANALSVINRDDPLPTFFLYARSIELFLKSFLLSVGIPENELKKKQFGHNLTSLLDEALRKGVFKLIGGSPITKARLCGLVHVLNYNYVTKTLEYREENREYLVANESLTKIILKRLERGLNFHLQRFRDTTLSNRSCHDKDS